MFDGTRTRHAVIGAVLLLVLSAFGAVMAGKAGKDFTTDLDLKLPALAKTPPILLSVDTPRLTRAFCPNRCRMRAYACPLRTGSRRRQHTARRQHAARLHLPRARRRLLVAHRPARRDDAFELIRRHQTIGAPDRPASNRS